MKLAPHPLSFLRHGLALVATLVIALVLVPVFGCQAIVNGDVPAFTCRDNTKNSCPGGMYCKGAGCVPCEKADPCDGLDNDCNGSVDDGPGSDADDDGVTFCGHFSQDEGKLVDVDCDDNNADVHPDAQETCNGVDDDCDGVVDNPDRVCDEGNVCAPTGGGCIPQADACSPDNCPAPKVCNPSSQQCENPTTNLPLGTDCAADDDCASHVCAMPQMVGNAIKGPKGVCSKPCCTSAQCAPGLVCFAAGTGGRFCIPAGKVGRPPTLGAGDPGASCTKATDCRSGVCTNNRCIDTCCSAGDCKGGTTCQLLDSGGFAFFGCLPQPGSGMRHATCSAPTDCTSNLCSAYPGFPTTSLQHCVAPCCSSTADCGTTDGTSVLCVNSSRSGLTHDSILGVCIGKVPTQATKNFGDTCSAPGECKTAQCDPATLVCTSICCLDSDCPSRSVCRPAASGVLRCVPQK